MIEKIIDDYNNDVSLELETKVDELSLRDIIKLYLRYSNPAYLTHKKNISKSLNLFYKKIISLLNSCSLSDLMDFYNDIFLDKLYFEDSIEGLKNIINVRNDNLKDDFFIEFESSKTILSKEDFIKKYIDDINNVQKNLNIHNETLKYIDSLQKNMFNCINEKMNNLESNEAKELLLQINKKIEEDSEEIIKRNNLRKNKKAVDIQNRISDNPTFGIFSLFDTTSLKNEVYVYKGYQATVLDRIKANKK